MWRLGGLCEQGRTSGSASMYSMSLKMVGETIPGAVLRGEEDNVLGLVAAVPRFNPDSKGRAEDGLLLFE